MTILGFAEQGPADGIGPFKALFDSGQRLLYSSTLEGLSAIVLWGGADISPSLYDEQAYTNSGPPRPSERDTFEWELIRQATHMGIPIIGVCRGAQMLCAYAGGKLIQHVTNHQTPHDIVAHTGETFRVNSFHHQMLYPFDIEHEMLAWSSTKLSTVYQPLDSYMSKHMETPAFEEPEVVYFPQINGFAIQCHPEWHMGADHEKFKKWIMEQILQHCFQKVEC